MSNIVEFVLRLKDQLSGGVRGAAATAQQAFGGVVNTLSQTQRAFNSAGTSGKNAMDGIASSAQNAAKQVDNLNNSMQRGGKTGSNFWQMAKGSFVGNFAATAATAGIGALMSQGSSVIGAGLESSKQRSQFEVLGGGKGAGLYGDLTKYIQDSVFGTELYGDARTLLSFGISVDQVMPSLKMLGDVAMGDKEKMGALTLAFAQTTSAGKLMGQDLLQYINAGFNPLQEISVMTGMSMEVLKDKMSEGAISAQMVQKAFEHATGAGGKFNGMLSKMGNTPFGRLQAMQGNFEAAKQQLGESLLPAVTGFLNGIQPVVDKLPVFMERIAPMGEKLFGLFTSLLPGLEEAGGAIGSVLAPVFGLLASDEVRDLAKNTLHLVAEGFKILAPVVNLVAESMKLLIDGINLVLGMIPGQGAPGTCSPSGDQMLWLAKMLGGDEFDAKGTKIAHRGDNMAYGQFNPLTGKFGAADKLLPFLMGAATSATSTNNLSSGAGNGALKEMGSNITGGGQKTINISFRNMIEELNITPATLSEGVKDIENIVKQSMARVLAGVPF